MASIFISYRKADVPKDAARLQADLAAAFGADALFRDSEALKAGDDWAAILKDEVDKCRVMLVVIGPAWLNIKANDGVTRRLDQPDDWVKLEVGQALQQSKRVIPVLIGDVTFPLKTDLPLELQGLAGKQYTTLTDPLWKFGVQALIEGIKPGLPEPEPPPKSGGSGKGGAGKGSGGKAGGGKAGGGANEPPASPGRAPWLVIVALALLSLFALYAVRPGLLRDCVWMIVGLAFAGVVVAYLADRYLTGRVSFDFKSTKGFALRSGGGMAIWVAFFLTGVWLCPCRDGDCGEPTRRLYGSLRSPDGQPLLDSEVELRGEGSSPCSAKIEQGRFDFEMPCVPT